MYVGTGIFAMVAAAAALALADTASGPIAASQILPCPGRHPSHFAAETTRWTRDPARPGRPPSVTVTVMQRARHAGH